MDSLQRYLRLHISCYTGAHPIFFELRRVHSGVVPLRLIVFIDPILLLDLFEFGDSFAIMIPLVACC